MDSSHASTAASPLETSTGLSSHATARHVQSSRPEHKSELIDGVATLNPVNANVTRKGVAWALANNGGRQLIAFATFVGLARMLTPESFGVVALASVMILFGNALLDQGLGEALIQFPQLRKIHVDSVFVVTLCLGLLLTVIYFLLAPSLAVLLGQPLLQDLLPALALQFPLNALAIAPQSLLQRSMHFRPLAMRGLASLFCGCAMALTCAYQGWEAWSLVVQQLVAAFIGTLVLWRASKWQPQWRISWASLRELHLFGRKVLFVGLLDLFKRKSDDFLIGSVLGSTALGFYGVAYQALLILEQLISKGFDVLALASLSRLQGDREALVVALRAAIRYSAAVSVPLFLLVSVYAAPLIEMAFGARWLAAAPVLQILTIAGAMHTVFHYNHAMFKALGHPEISVRFGVMGAVLNLLGFAISVQWGIGAVAWSYVITGYLMIPMVLHNVRKLSGVTAVQYVRWMLPALIGGAAMLGLLYGLERIWGPAETLSGIVVGGTLSLALYFLVVDFLAPDLRKGLRQPTTTTQTTTVKPTNGALS